MHRMIKSAVESKDGERPEHPYVTRSQFMKIAEDFTDWYDKNRSTIIKNVLTIWKTTKDTGYAVLIDQHWDRPMPLHCRNSTLRSGSRNASMRRWRGASVVSGSPTIPNARTNTTGNSMRRP